MGVRPPEFWQPYYHNTQMLDLVRQKLQNEPTIFEVSEPFIQKIKEGTLQVLEFVAPLSRFCKAIVDWYDASKLLELSRDQVRAVYRVIRAIKNTLEGFKSTILSRNVKIPNPLVWFDFYLKDINDHHSSLKSRVEAQLRQTGQSTTIEVADTNESFLSTVDVADRKVSPPGRLSFLDAESDSDGSDDDAHPFRSGQKRPARHRHGEDKPDIEQLTMCSAPDLVAIGPKSSSETEDEEKVPAGSSAINSGQSTSKIAKSESDTDTPRLKVEPEIESEQQQQEAADRAIEDGRKDLVNAYELRAEVLGDLWITHQLIKSSIHFNVTEKVKEQNFKLPKIDHLTYPRSQLQGSLSTPPTTSDGGDEMKALPMELLIIIEIPIENNQILDDPQGYFKLTLNGNSLLVDKTHLDGATANDHSSASSFFEAYNTIKAKLPQGTLQQKPKTIKGKITIGVVTMVSEKEIFERSITAPCPNKRTAILANRSGVTDGAAQIDPIEGGIIRCPVRGTACAHVQCFELYKFIQLNKFKSDWICPVENCDKTCKPFFELEFDNWVFGSLLPVVV
ncbi:hypothetical protein PSTT_16643 [Puccinia striiformis]|uniref:SP-RING-type domain-containing protein n=1 Tax=Puccinia striiformis TaxID=27350 RepID=A0A2S4UBY7_9BASI|nr:hypothetical protein PSTT_16643 [Puccinia striiformis]